jgi:arylsulfatase A-like enzyme
MYKLFSLLTVVITLGCWSCDSNSSSNTAAEKTKKPNVLFILADQWRGQATGYSGDPNLVGKTPNLDQMAAQGVNFKNAISVTPVCTPYRAALMTGQYATTTGMIFNDLHLPDEAVTMAELYQDAGYNTAYIGKWHLDGMGRFAYTPPERRQGFEYWKALECSHDYNNMIYYEGTNEEPQKREGYSPYGETEDAISYIKSHANSEDPFLMVLAWGTPHFPHDSAPEELKKEFPKEDIVLRGNVPEEMQERVREEAVGYYAHILALDKCMGNLQKALEEAGIAENTIVVFTADHGEMMGSQGVTPKQKQVPWIESVSIPFLLQYPARFGKEKIEIEAPINVTDVLPSLLSLSDIEVPEFIEGENMAEAIVNPDQKIDKAALVINVAPFARNNDDEYRGIYTDRYAYVKKLDGPWLLFDHDKDPLQMNNLVNKPEYEELQQQMEARLQQELKRIGDEFKPRDYYIEKWGYELTQGGYIDYSKGAPHQGPDMVTIN